MCVCVCVYMYVCVCVCVLRPLQCHGSCSADHETWKWTKPGQIAVDFLRKSTGRCGFLGIKTETF